MSQSLQAYVTDPTSCAIDRAPIAAPMPTPRAQKHHEKAVARCAKSTVEAVAATLELVVLRLARGVRALGAFFGKRRFRALPRRARRRATPRGAPRAPRAHVAVHARRGRGGPVPPRRAVGGDARARHGGTARRIRPRRRWPDACIDARAARCAAGGWRPRRPAGARGRSGERRRRRAAGDAAAARVRARPRRGEGDAPRRLGPRGAAALARRPPRSESDARPRQSREGDGRELLQWYEFERGRAEHAAARGAADAVAGAAARLPASQVLVAAWMRGSCSACATSLRCARPSRRRANSTTRVRGTPRRRALVVPPLPPRRAADARLRRRLALPQPLSPTSRILGANAAAPSGTSTRSITGARSPAARPCGSRSCGWTGSTRTRTAARVATTRASRAASSSHPRRPLRGGGGKLGGGVLRAALATTKTYLPPFLRWVDAHATAGARRVWLNINPAAASPAPRAAPDGGRPFPPPRAPPRPQRPRVVDRRAARLRAPRRVADIRRRLRPREPRLRRVPLHLLAQELPREGRRREGLLPRARRRAAAVHGRRRPRLHPGEPAARRTRVPRRVRSAVSLCVSLLLNATHTQDRHGCTEALSLSRLSRLSESRRLSTGNRPGRATPSCPSPPCPRTPTCRTRCPRRRRRRTG